MISEIGGFQTDNPDNSSTPHEIQIEIDFSSRDFDYCVNKRSELQIIFERLQATIATNSEQIAIAVRAIKNSDTKRQESLKAKMETCDQIIVTTEQQKSKILKLIEILDKKIEELDAIKNKAN